jgi:hypothetical protein
MAALSRGPPKIEVAYAFDFRRIAFKSTVADVTRLTVVGSQTEADVICTLLRAHGIQVGDRGLGPVSAYGGTWGGWREVFVSKDDLLRARELLAAKPEALSEE